MKTISINRAQKINEQCDEISVGMFAVVDSNGSLLAVRGTEAEAHNAASEIESEFDRETEVVLVADAE